MTSHKSNIHFNEQSEKPLSSSFWFNSSSTAAFSAIAILAMHQAVGNEDEQIFNVITILLL